MNDKAIIPFDLESTEKLAVHFVKSGLFNDTRDVSQAVVKILAGRELGFTPFVSMNGIYIIAGKTILSANLMASAVKRSGRFDYRIVAINNDECRIKFYERVDGTLQEIGESVFTRQDAIKAGTKNLEKFPRNMLFARAMSNGVRWFCPDVFNTPVYTPEEFDIEVDENGTPISGSLSANVDVVDIQEPAKPEPKKEKPMPENPVARPYTPEELASVIQQAIQNKITKGYTTKSDVEKDGEKLRKMVKINMLKIFDNDELKQKSLLVFLVGKNSTKELTDAEAVTLYRWMNVKQNNQGEWVVDNFAYDEAWDAMEYITEKQKHYMDALMDDADGFSMIELDGKDDIDDDSDEGVIVDGEDDGVA